MQLYVHICVLHMLHAVLVIQENVDFQQCYRNHLLLKELKEKVEFGSYPPRLKLGIKVKNRSFFGTQQRLEFVLMGGKESLQKNITIAAAFNGMCFCFCGLGLPNVVSLRYSLEELLRSTASFRTHSFYSITLFIFVYT